MPLRTIDQAALVNLTGNSGNSCNIGLDLDGWLRLLDSRHGVEIDLGLDRCAEVYRRMGSPRPGKLVITVAGTNGKGSTVACIAAMFSALGKRTASYTTPHISRYNERIRVGEICASDEQIIDAFAIIERARGDISLSYFEFGTLAALVIFNRSRIDIAILEVGLGGRLDAVNLVDCDCAVITPIGLDHEAFLGTDRQSIGYEKAGIIRPEKPVVCGESKPPASVLEVATRLKAPLYRIGHEFKLETEADQNKFEFGVIRNTFPLSAMAGNHQQMNMATALAAVLVSNPSASNEIDLLVGALTRVSLPGRLQVLQTGPKVLVDVGHNEMAAAVVASYISRHSSPVQVSSKASCGRCLCILAMLADKNAEAVIRHLEPVVTTWFTAGLEGSRGQSGSALATRVRKESKHEIQTHQRVSEALEAALEMAKIEDTILIFGSFETAGQATAHFLNNR